MSEQLDELVKDISVCHGELVKAVSFLRTICHGDDVDHTFMVGRLHTLKSLDVLSLVLAKAINLQKIQ